MLRSMSANALRLVLLPVLLVISGCAAGQEPEAAGPPPGFREQPPFVAGATVGDQYDYWLGHSPDCGPAPALIDGTLWQVTNGTAARPGFTSPWQAGQLTIDSEDEATFVADGTTVELERTAFTDYLDVPGGNCV